MCSILLDNIHEEGYGEARDSLFSKGHSKRTRSNGYKLQPRDCDQAEGKNIFLHEGGAALQQVPREAMGSLSMEISKTCLDKALSNLI